jgi:hypothetical protein
MADFAYNSRNINNLAGTMVHSLLYHMGVAGIGRKDRKHAASSENKNCLRFLLHSAALNVYCTPHYQSNHQVF